MHGTLAVVGAILILLGVFVALPVVPGTQISTNIFVLFLGGLLLIPIFAKSKTLTVWLVICLPLGAVALLLGHSAVIFSQYNQFSFLPRAVLSLL